MVHRLWSMVYRLWSMVYGLWSIVYRLIFHFPQTMIIFTVPIINVMDQGSESFRKKIEQLMELFKRFAEKMEKEGLSENNPYSMNFKMMLENYDRMKNFLPDDIPENLRAPFEHMLNDLINKLRDEIGDMPQTPVQVEQNNQTLEEIEQKLKLGNLSPQEMDELLDKLISLKKGGS